MNATDPSRTLRAGISLLLLSLFLLQAVAVAPLYGGTTSMKKTKKELVSERLTRLFELCREHDHAAMASYLVYRGENKKRNWKDTYRYDGTEENKQVEWRCDYIRKLLLGYDSYEFGDVEIDTESEGEWVALEVTFKKGEEYKKMRFAFLKIKGKYSLGDMDTD